MDYAVIERGGRFTVHRAEEVEGGIVFPPYNGLTGYQRAVAFAKQAQEDRREAKNTKAATAARAQAERDAEAGAGGEDRTPDGTEAGDWLDDEPSGGPCGS